jgi:hypothetical protein
LNTAFSQLRALSQWNDRFASCGLNSDELGIFHNSEFHISTFLDSNTSLLSESILTELGCMLKAWQQLHLVLSTARINYLAFFHLLSECVRVFGEAAQVSWHLNFSFPGRSFEFLIPYVFRSQFELQSVKNKHHLVWHFDSAQTHAARQPCFSGWIIFFNMTMPHHAIESASVCRPALVIQRNVSLNSTKIRKMHFRR